MLLLLLVKKGGTTMMSCKNCNSWNLFTLDYGGCGGIDSLVGCEDCKTVFKQTTGGIIPTPGGENWDKEPYTLEEYRERQK